MKTEIEQARESIKEYRKGYGQSQLSTDCIIQLMISHAKEQIETKELEQDKELLIPKIKQNLKEINIDKKITDYNFDLGYSLGFLDGNDFSSQIPELTLDQAVEKAKPNMDKIKDVDAHLNEIK